MLNFLYAEVNIVGAMVLLLMLTNRNKSSFQSMPIDQQIFNGVMLLNLLIFLFDTGMWLVDGTSLPILKTVNIVVTTLYYLSNPLICFLWMRYTDYKIHESQSGLLLRTRLYAVPVVVCTGMTLASPFTGWFFIINKENHYIRGPFFLVMVIISTSYLVLSCGMALKDLLKNGWEVNKGVNLPLVAFPVGVITAAAIQVRFFGVSIIWVCAMLACTSIYINIQNGEVSTDHLTGLYNRRRLDQHLKRRVKTKREGRLLFAVILDVDEFKKINDSFGHMEGDIALIKTADLLRKSCKKSEDFIARLGGDEFIIVGERPDAAEIELLIEKIKHHVTEYNKSGALNYSLALSMGYSIYHGDDTEDSFLANADKEMYRYKMVRKSAAAALSHNK